MSASDKRKGFRFSVRGGGLEKQERRNEMEKMKTAKELRKEAEAIILGKVTNRESYELALKMVFETLERAKLLTDAAKAFKRQAERIGELAAAYAQEHETALDEPLHEEKDGIMSGAVTVEGVTYRLTLTRDKLKRISGANMTAEFLAKLPKAWTKEKRELDTTAINEAEVTDAELAKHDLVRPGKAVWSRKEEASLE